MRAEIITVGTEILLGDIVNTNSQFLAKELANIGIDVYHQGTVGDNETRLMESLNEGLKR
ncbi:MAG: molybdopterin-binding protein, partial [Paraclostridium dentum]